MAKVRVNALVLVALVVAMLPSAALARVEPETAGAAAFVLDTLSPGGSEVVRAFHDPGDSSINITWTGSGLTVSATPTGGSTLSYDLSSTPAAALAAGEYPDANINGCAGTLSIASISPALELGTSTTVTELSATFSRSCGGYLVNGEIRLGTADGYAAIGMTYPPDADYAVSAVGGAASFVGKRSVPFTATLKNLGSTTLTLGTATVDQPVDADWQITANTCSGTLAPGATCAISVTAVSWIPNAYEDYLTLPVDTVRGSVHVLLQSSFAGARFVPLASPVRLVDTRSGVGVSSVLTSGVARTFTAINRNPGTPDRNIPPEAVAVTGNLTIIKPTAAGYASLTTSASNAPATKTLYLAAGEIRNNAVVTRLSDTGTLGLTWQGATGSRAHAAFDATGYFVPVDPVGGLRIGNYRPYGPARIVNTRLAKGISSKLVAGKPRTFTVPLAGVQWENTAVTGVVTVLTPAASGSLYIGPSPVAAPSTSTLNFAAGDARANTFFATLHATGAYGTPKTLSITYVGPPGSSVDVVIDIHGILGEENGYAYVPLVPNRVVDSTVGKVLANALPSQQRRSLNVANRVPADPSRNLPADSSTVAPLFKFGLVGNLWMVKPTAGGTLTATTPGTATPPQATTIPGPAGARRAQTVVLGWTGSLPVNLDVYFAAPRLKSTHVQFDSSGYFIY